MKGSGDLSYCWMCGDKNPKGLHLIKEMIDGVPSMKLYVDKYICGFTGILHGGVTAGLMDEVMCYAAGDIGPVMTIKMEVKYKSPGLEGHTLVAEGKVEREDERDVYISSVVRDVDTGKIVAKGEGVYRKVNFEVKLPKAQTE